MTLPHKLFTIITSRGLSGDDDNNNFDNVGEWLDTQLGYGKIGNARLTSRYQRYDSLFRPSEDKFKLLAVADGDDYNEIVMDVVFDFIATKRINTSSHTTVKFGVNVTTEAQKWLNDLVTGKYYDGENDWGSYPRGSQGLIENIDITIASLPSEHSARSYTFQTGIGWSYAFQAYLIRSGLWAYAHTYAGGSLDDGEEATFNITPRRIKINLFNAVVNSLSAKIFKTAGAGTLVLAGLGFNNALADMNYTGSPGPNRLVDYIYLEGLEGQGSTTLTRDSEFTVDSDAQITITMPALAAGTYEMKLSKSGSGSQPVNTIESYAGDYRCAADGKMIATTRFAVLVSDSYTTRPTRDNPKPIYFTDWYWEKKDGTESIKNWSNDFVSFISKAYEGRLLSLSPLTREVDDETGIFSVSDLVAEVAQGNTYEIAKLFAEYMIRNRAVDLFFGFQSEPIEWKESVCKMIVDDHDDDSEKLTALLKDITQKYFKRKLPKYTCTEEEYTNIHDSAKNQPMPDILGLHSYTGTDSPGAFKALHVDTVNHIYLAARGSLHSITEVYSANTAKATPGDYSITYGEGGRTYIDFVADQGDNEIRFNCKGYMYSPWNSANGYVENPAYVLGFLIAFIIGVPGENMDLESFDTLAAVFTAAGYDEIGKHAIDATETPDNSVSRLLWTFGIRAYTSKEGLYSVKRFDVSAFATALIIFSEIDCKTPPVKHQNAAQAVNIANVAWDYVSAPGRFKGAKEKKWQQSIDDNLGESEDPSAWEFPCSTSEAWVDERVQELFYQRGYGNRKVSLSLPVLWLTELDLFTVFRLQDPSGYSLTGAGTLGHYYYITKITVDFDNDQLDIEAEDLQWLLRQYLILGDESAISLTWAAATDPQRMFAYLPNEVTGKFADGEPGKMLADENLFGG